MCCQAKSNVGWIVLLTCVLVSLARSERLPVKVFTTADGLAHNSVHRIVSDSHGFLWICTAEGLSRFDGYTFKNYGLSDGLPDPHVYDVLEDRNGVYWVATAAGLCRSKQPKSNRSETTTFQYSPLPTAAGLEVHSLAEGHDGTIWVGTAKALSRSVGGESHEVFRLLDSQTPSQPDWPITCLLEDYSHVLWIGTGNGLFRRWPDGHLQRSGVRALDDVRPWINRLREDDQGNILIASSHGVVRVDSTASHRSASHVFVHKRGTHTDFSFDSLPLRDHILWTVMLDGLSRVFAVPQKSQAHLVPVTASIGLGDYPLEAMSLDRDENLWIGSDGGGVSRIAHNGLTAFNEEDGLGSHDIISVFEDANGRLIAVSRSRDSIFLNQFSSGKFHAFWVNLPSDFVSLRWRGHYQIVVSGARRNWLFATRHGLASFSRITDLSQLAHVRPQMYLPNSNIIRLFQDRHNDLWISQQHHVENILTIRNGRTGRFYFYAANQGVPNLANDRIQAYCEDQFGNLWMGLEYGGLWRKSLKGFTHFNLAGGSAGNAINWLYTDDEGRVWAGSRAAGVHRIDHPGGDQPTFANYTINQGLSSNEILCIAEDLMGRIYLCTARGVDRLEPATGHVKHYSTADGLTGGELQTAYRDRMGNLWFGTQQGLSRLTPASNEPITSVPVLLSGIHIEGRSLAMSQVGETNVRLHDLSPGRDQLQFDFTGISFRVGEILRYQYKLQGTGDIWSSPTAQRSVIYAGLRPGSYQFLVRAVTSDGIASPQPASVVFTILAPFWLRWWFVLGMFGIALSILYGMWRYRLGQLAAVQRVRMHIAADLHDDIGSGLSQIAILSEMVRRQASVNPAMALEQIANVSRELVDSMSDIVWATGPGRDQIDDLAVRMNHFASEVLGGSDILFRLKWDMTDAQTRLSVNVRRQVYLIFKECLTNIIRHSQATEANVSLSCDATWLTLEIKDNGKGFDISRSSPGNGLASMRERTKSLRGQIRISSGSEGTAIKMFVALRGAG
jgi:ligand-binding sensor domain-containing protein/two-component sensor histidine kinase